MKALASIGSLVFCVPPNDRLDHYRDVVEDRLVKIRNSQNIEGVRRRLALFELLQAMARRWLAPQVLRAPRAAAVQRAMPVQRARR